MPKIRPDDYLDDGYDSDDEFAIDNDENRNRRGQVIHPKNPERWDPNWEENRRHLQRKFRRDYD